MKEYIGIYTVTSSTAIIERVRVEKGEDPTEKFFTQISTHVENYDPTRATEKLTPMILATNSEVVESFEEGRVTVGQHGETGEYKFILMEVT